MRDVDFSEMASSQVLIPLSSPERMTTYVQSPSLGAFRPPRPPAARIHGHASEVNRLIKVTIPNSEKDRNGVDDHVWSSSFDKSILIWSFRGRSRPRCRQELFGHKGSVDFLLCCEKGIVCSSSADTKDKSLHFWQYQQFAFKDDPKHDRLSFTDVLSGESVPAGTYT